MTDKWFFRLLVIAWFAFWAIYTQSFELILIIATTFYVAYKMGENNDL